MKIRRTIAITTTIPLLLLAACSEEDPAPEAESSQPTVTQTKKEPGPSEPNAERNPAPPQKDNETNPGNPEPGGDPGNTCGNLSAQQALSQNVGKVPEYKPGWTWNTEQANTDLYDPCADLSLIVITVDGGTTSSPYHIMLFRKGEYLGTATAEPQGFAPGVERVDGQTIAVTYRYPQQGDANADPTGEAHATFTWDPAQGKVVMNGDLPPQG